MKHGDDKHSGVSVVCRWWVRNRALLPIQFMPYPVGKRSQTDGIIRDTGHPRKGKVVFVEAWAGDG
jgi:hypothetical protein